TNKVVPRAEFTIRFVNLLPESLLAALQGADVLAVGPLQSVRLVVDLFEPSGVPMYALEAAKLRYGLAKTDGQPAGPPMRAPPDSRGSTAPPPSDTAPGGHTVTLQPKRTLGEAARTLGVSKRLAHVATTAGLAMLAAGITDPFIRLTEVPLQASRWRVHAK